ncbi:MAG TPA: YebC/PmpR family DNA-binding transcriptional regulator [Sphaerochaeta sp.]|nr:YebC/PmpR family DNA-binding transcriptional regulator [Sphaerochaeta sp.]
MGRAFEYRKAAKLKRWGHMAKTFTKLGKQIAIAVKAGGPDPDMNPTLRGIIATCKRENMPKDNIERAIKKGSGEMGNTVFMELVYEGYAPGGVAIIVDTLTDNKNRTAADVRSTLTKLGGSLGSSGCVSYMFQTKGVITYDASKYSEDDIFNAALENGAEDVSSEDGVIEVTTSPADFGTVLEAMQAAGFEQDSADVSRIADQTVTLDKEKAQKVMNIVERLEDLDDVQSVATNLELPDDYDEE